MNKNLRNLYRNMQKKTMSCAVLTVIIAQSIEWFIFFMYCITNTLETKGFTKIEYIQYHCLKTFVMYSVSVGFGYICILQKKNQALERMGPLLSLCSIAAIVMQRHYTFPIVFMLPCIPIMLSSLYASYNILTLTTILSIASMTAGTISAIFYGRHPIEENTTYNILIGYILLLAMHIIMRFMIQIEIEKIRLMESTFSEKERLRYDSTHDERTKIANLKGLELAFDIFLKNDGYITILDIDHFKLCNDTYGHAFGDIVLERLGQILLSYESDCVKTGRFGGEEFVILTKNINYKETCQIVAEILKRFTNEKYREVPETIHFTFSAGITKIDRYADMEKNIANADKYLYIAKNNGRNQIIGANKENNNT